MFQRREPVSLMKRSREFIWPSMGWRRMVHYYYHRLFRGGLSPHQITGGLACGVALSFSPLIGTHILQAFGLAWLLGFNRLAALVGTLAGNPWTFPPMYFLAYHVGKDTLGFLGLEQFEPLGAVTFGELFAHPLTLLLPMMVGGYLCALLAWPLVYGLLYYPVRRTAFLYHRTRQERRDHRRRQKDVSP